ncbi:uncharacterized protein LOC121999443 [Zingiber officinale]|uniref:uncharacterized protein LOC121999443 n=1 Tax=Zingiber officinale TaxID=94328 RepID=UPI001C4C56BD|nr:uncharacterized protein LOC121999443 [Zingiber officinale]
MEHSLHVYPDARPLKQKKRDFGADQNQIIKEEVDKLMEAGCIREVQFPSWLANVVMVSPGNKWRVYIDFRDLNKACPKDYYPLPRIDQVVDSTAGWVTYQRLMNKVFRKQIGRNMEVYVDDILIKSLQPRSTIKAQAFADFIIEVQGPEEEGIWKVYVDGSSTRQGSGIRILLISPKEDRIQLSVSLSYRATNNEAEYETLIAGLQASRHVGAPRVQIYSDSQLAAQQLTGKFEINNDRLKLYAEAFDKLRASFQEVNIQKIPRLENQVADELEKLASAVIPWNLDKPVEQTILVSCIEKVANAEIQGDWRAPIILFLQQGILPANVEHARVFKKKATRYTLIGDHLYKRAFSSPLLKCIRTYDIPYILQEVHQVSCLFDLWGMNIVGPFPLATTQRRFLLVAVDYFSKWVEAEPLARITESAVIKFLWQNIICRFGIPHKLVSDNGRQFQGKRIEEWYAGYDITQAFTSVAYPQSNGQAEVTNREIIRGLKTKLDHVGGSWVDELPSALWAYRTTLREATGITPIQLVYGGEAIVPIEVGVESDRRRLYNEEDNADRRLMELDLIEEALNL